MIAAFLSHWSLLDGSPRNSLQQFLDGQAHRPFAYRMLAPALVLGIDQLAPAELQSALSERVAPVFRKSFTDLFLDRFGSRFASVRARAEADWSRADYRRHYVTMVGLMYAAFAGAMLLLHRAARALGASAGRAFAAMLLYACITPTMFLNGGYFYDFTEQLGATAFLCCVLESRWRLALLTLIVAQANKETALLLVPFMTALAWPSLRLRVIPAGAAAFALCMAMMLWVRSAHSHLPGASMEWHWPGNLSFWSSAASWLAVEDMHSLGLALPRMTFLVFAVGSLAWGWWRGITPLLVAACLAFGVLAGLQLTLGFRDEFRNLSLAMPLLVLVMFEPRKRRCIPQTSASAPSST